MTPTRDRSAKTASKLAVRCLLHPGALAAALLFASAAQGAGGHHAVDDAALLDPGQCQFEAWWDREARGARTLLHAGPACRLGPVEFGVSLDRTRLDGSKSAAVAGLQVKWARSISDDWSVGLAVATSGQSRAPRYLGSTVLVPITWQVTETLLTHINLGRDFRRGDTDTAHGGLALEWAALSNWAFVAERFKEGGGSFRRTGIRWALTPAANVDLSRSQAIGGNSSAWWTLGLAWVWN